MLQIFPAARLLDGVCLIWGPLNTGFTVFCNSFKFFFHCSASRRTYPIHVPACSRVDLSSNSKKMCVHQDQQDC